VKSSDNNTESNYDDYTDEPSSYNTESSLKFNSSDDYDYNELIEDTDCEEKPGFFEKMKLIHRDGTNATINKHVKHINQTFDLIKNALDGLKPLFPTDRMAGLEFLEFLTEIDLRLSSECSSALIRILSSLRKFDFWALKCKFKVQTYRLCNC